MWRMSSGTPEGSALCPGDERLTGGSNPPATPTGIIGTTGDAQHPHVHRTQNAGQPLSGPDSLVPTPQFSGTTSAVTPLASANNRAKSTMRNARRIRSMVYHG